MFGTKTDPVPYMIAAYLVATVMLLGYSAWLYNQRKKLRQLEQAIHEGGRKG